MTPYLLISLAVIGYVLFRHYKAENAEQAPETTLPPQPAPKDPVQRDPECFIECWLRDNNLSFSDDSTTKLWRYSLRIALENVVVDVRLVLERDSKDFIGAVNFPVFFQDNQFQRLTYFMETFNETEPYSELYLDKNNGALQLRASVSGKDIAVMDASCQYDCIRLLLSRAEALFPELIGITYGHALPEIALLRTIGLRSSALN